MTSQQSSPSILRYVLITDFIPRFKIGLRNPECLPNIKKSLSLILDRRKITAWSIDGSRFGPIVLRKSRFKSFSNRVFVTIQETTSTRFDNLLVSELCKGVEIVMLTKSSSQRKEEVALVLDRIPKPFSSTDLSIFLITG